MDASTLLDRIFETGRMLVLVGAVLIAAAVSPTAGSGSESGRDAAAPPSPSGLQEFPRAWFWGNDQQRAAHDALVGQPPPELAVGRWIGDPQTLEALRGKVVVVDFWGAWCGECLRTLAMNRSLVEEHTAEGFVLLGIHDSRRGLERLDNLLQERGFSCIVGVDDDGRSERAWRVFFWPTYAVIDRAGIVRGVGLRPDRVPEVVRILLAEPMPVD
jgi:thiol-disulfide isomerase/thioredoxin